MGLKQRIRTMDEQLGAPLTRGRHVGERAAGHASLQMSAVRRRRAHREHFEPRDADACLQELRRDGVTVLPGVFDPALLADLRRDFEQRLDEGRDLDAPPHDAVRQPGERDNTPARVPDEIMAQGQDVFRHHTNRVTMTDPMVRMPSLLDLTLREEFIDMAAAYLHSVPAVGSVTLRKSFANDLPVFDTLYFHVDPNSLRFLKFFVYFHDVGPGGGPFAYVRGSHRKRFPGWSTRRRWSEEEILEHYDPARITPMTARVGDVVVADTTGFHRGTKPVDADRVMLTISYVLQPEYGGRFPRNAMRSQDLDRLSGKQRAAAELLDPR